MLYVCTLCILYNVGFGFPRGVGALLPFISPCVEDDVSSRQRAAHLCSHFAVSASARLPIAQLFLFSLQHRRTLVTAIRVGPKLHLIVCVCVCVCCMCYCIRRVYRRCTQITLFHIYNTVRHNFVYTLIYLGLPSLRAARSSYFSCTCV